MKPYRQVQRALELSNAGWNNCQIAREIGVNRRTVSDWVRGRSRRRRRGSPAVVPSYPYAYLLGLYLGDGHIAHHPRDVYRLRIFLDRSHPLHERKIALEPWQRLIVDRYPGRLLRGLVHSDGCRVVNRVRHPKKTYAYPGISSATARMTSKDLLRRL